MRAKSPLDFARAQAYFDRVLDAVEARDQGPTSRDDGNLRMMEAFDSTPLGTAPAVPRELRIRFHQQLAEIDAEVVRLFAIVCERVVAATESLSTGDDRMARSVTGADIQVDELERELEQLTERLLLTETPMCGDMRYLVTVLRIVPQLERCGDLAEHVAQRTVTGLGLRLTPGLRALLTDMGSHCAAMWRMAAQAWTEGDVGAAARLDAIDDELDALHGELMADIVTADIDVADAMQAALVGRFYERLGDHAVHLSERIGYMVSSPVG